MRILHTSDWHLGRSLMGKSRYREHDQFLSWLFETIEDQSVDVLLVAGDVFDTTTPSNRAQKQYFDFLYKVSTSCCRHVVVIGGNHDSPTLLDAPRQPLIALNVHVVGCARDPLEDEVIALKDELHQIEMIVCAVPYLRDRDVRSSEPGETLAERERKLKEGIRCHYSQVADIAQSVLAEVEGHVPVVATGHLFTAGGSTTDDDGVRDLYVGTLAHLDSNVFPKLFDYVALGHLHVPQSVGNSRHIVYSGSPIPMGFGEANHQKVVSVVEFSGTDRPLDRKEVRIPCFQHLARVVGDLESIRQQANDLASTRPGAWIEVVYEGDEVVPDLSNWVESCIVDSDLSVLRIVDSRKISQVLESVAERESLEELNVFDVFERRLDQDEISDKQRRELKEAYAEIVTSVLEEDPNQE